MMPNQALAQAPSIIFVADRYVINAGECVNNSWDAQNVQLVRIRVELNVQAKPTAMI